MLDKIKSRLNYAKAELWQAKFSAAQISLSSIITAKFSTAKLWKAQFWSHRKTTIIANIYIQSRNL